MASNTDTSNNRIVDILKNKQKLVISVLFLIFFLIPISSENWGTITNLLDQSIERWLQVIPQVYSELTTSVSEIIDLGIGRTVSFVGDFLNFYFSILSFDLNIFSQTGIILSTFFFSVPVIIIYLLVKLYQKSKEVDFREKMINNFRSKLSTKNLLILVLLVPFASTESWLIGLVMVFIVILYLRDILGEQGRSFSNFPWLRIYFLFVISIIFILPLLGLLLSKPDLSLASFLELPSGDITLILVVLAAIVYLLTWFVRTFMNPIEDSQLRQLIVTIRRGVNISTILKLAGLPILFIPAVDYFIVNSIAEQTIFFAINIPWVVVLLFHDPQQYVDMLINIIRAAFDDLTNVARSITTNLIPIRPTDESIIGSVQDTFFVTALLFFVALLIYAVILLLITSSEEPNVSLNSRIKKLRKYWIGIFVTFIAAIVFYLLDPPTFLRTYGAQYEIQTVIWPLLLVSGITFVLIMSLVALFFWITKRLNSEDRGYRGVRTLFVITCLSVIVLLISLVFQDISVIADLEQMLGLDMVGLFSTLSIVFFSVTLLYSWITLQLQKGRSLQIVLGVASINIIAIIVAIIMIVPFIQMIKVSLQTHNQNIQEFYQQGILPDPFYIGNYAQLFGLFPPPYSTEEYRVVTWLFNSVLVSVVVTGFLVLFSAMAGYCFAKRDFIGRKPLYAATIAILMVPSYVQVIPLLLELNYLNFVATLLGVILPFLIQPLGVFLTTEFMRGIPDDYIDAARIDGYSELQIFWKVVLPLSIPVISVLFIINFIGNWNAFIWPFLLIAGRTGAENLLTLPLGMDLINRQSIEEHIGVILALATVIVVPVFVILFLAQDYIKKGVTVEGLKG